MAPLTHLLHWLDADISRYWAVAWTAFAATAALSVLPDLPWLLGRAQPPAGRAWRVATNPAVYVLALTLTFAAFRWPVWFTHGLGNPDESQLMAGAITLRDSPVFWQSVDGHTSGPFDYFAPLALPLLTGLKVDYFSTRITGTLLHLLGLLGIWFAARRLLSEGAARLGLLPSVVLLGTTTYGDFVQYNSEMMPIALLALGVAAGAGGLTATSPRRAGGWFALAGVLLGAAPFAKLQATPIAGTLGGLLLIALGTRWWRKPQAETLRQAAWLVAGLLGPAALIGGFLLVYGLAPQFWEAFILNNVRYTSNGNLSSGWVYDQWFPFIRTVPGFTGFFLGHLALFAALGVLALVGGGRTRWVVLAGWLTLGVTFLAIVLPGRNFGHYLQFMIPALAFLIAAHYQGVKEFLTAGGESGGRARWRWVPLLAVLAVGVGPPLQARREEPMDFGGAFTNFTQPWIKPVSYVISTRAQPGDRLTVWGWMPAYYVETGLPQGARDAHTQRMITPGPRREFYRDRFMGDLARNRPRWFVDAVGPGNFYFTDRALDGHETFPALATLVAADYEFIVELEGTRIYRRKDP